MRAALLPLALLPLAACVQPEPPVADPRAQQEAACAAAIAAHIRQPVAGVTARRVADTGGTATVEARDGNRLHLCRVDASGRVLGYSHPGA